MKKLIAILLAVTLLAAVLPGAALADGKKTIYISSTGDGTMNLRKGPGKEYGVKGYVHHGDKVTQLDTDGIWSKVKTASNKVGWIKTKYIDGTTKKLGTGYKLIDGTPTMRSGPGGSYSSKGKVKDGSKVKVLYTEDDWAKVRVSSTGKTGWIKASYIGGSAPSSSGGKDKGKEKSKKKSSSSTASGGTGVYHVTATSLNMRTGAGTGYDLIRSLGWDTPLKLVSTSGNWAKVRTFGGTTGWVSRTYIGSGADATVTASSLNLRASANGKITGSLGYGTLVTVTSISGNWAKVTVGKKSGWVSLNYLDI
ncbi:MAG: SH3 domain-containing protein [Clostridia bacterium]|nr:SH3 domain-containing protein [Clostridia bacterium]